MRWVILSASAFISRGEIEGESKSFGEVIGGVHLEITGNSPENEPDP
jgi:hypothetical protein